MTIPEFKEKLQTIHQTLFSEEALDNNEADQSYFDVLYPFATSLNKNVYPFFAFREESESTIEFIFNNRVADLFMVSKDHMFADDPMVYIKTKAQWESFEFSLSTLLLTEYVNWIAENTSSKLEFRLEGYAMYVRIKKNWNQFFNPFSYPDKIWIGKELKSVILIQNEIGMLKCIAIDAGNLQIAQKLLEESHITET
ncbi:hypothetical protein [Pedobacter africanus]|uniref:Uncharacterized protein n=1 Tax=Pedobacter africanus TaxID=151894 RepID=A0A1W1YLL1_9SPHI|nr:hypothetical protein [Pedobacter africanus]SMC37006.1 hypothetical protein SAMN04488524_0014 [Pedobacter africanus]